MVRKLVALIAAVILGAGLALAAPSAASAACIWCPYQNRATTRCMDDSFEFGLRSFPCNGSYYQQFRHEYGTAALINRHTGRCVDDSIQFGLRAFPCNGSSYQSWYLHPKNRPPFRYIAWASVATGRYIDDSEYGLRAFPGNNSDYQNFYLP